MKKTLIFRIGRDDYDKFKNIHDIIQLSLTQSGIKKARHNVSMNKTFKFMINIQDKTLMPAQLAGRVDAKKQ